MIATTARLEREIALLAGRLAAPAAALSPMALAERLDPEEWHEVLSGYQRACVQAIERWDRDFLRRPHDQRRSADRRALAR